LVFWQAGTVAGFDELVTEALTAPFSGWDFSWLDRRSWTEPLPWDYSARVAALARNARTMLDMGTGGGEVLSRLPDRAPRTVATEAWPPNVPLAARRLLPLGRILGIETAEEPESWIGLAERQVTEAGLAIEEAARADQRIRFDDIAAVVFYLKAVSWSIPGYSLHKYRDRLRALYEDASAWPVMTSGHRFLLVASKPG
jgi:hypothetical protein